MIDSRDLTPTWATARSGFAADPGGLDALRRLLDGRRLIRLDGPRGRERIAFRHDRVRSSVLAAALRRRMDDGSLLEETWREPFYAELIGEALMMDAYDPRHAERALVENPLALAFALKFETDPQSQGASAVAALLSSWATGVRGEHSSTAPVTELQWILSDISSPHIASICDSFADASPLLDEARFCNGDPGAGAAYCRYAQPSVRWPARDMLIAHVAERHGANLVDGVNVGLLNETSPGMVIGYLNLAGELARPALAAAVRACWERTERRPEYLATFLWAAARCGGDNPAAALSDLLAYWESLPEPSTGDDQNTGRGVVDRYQCSHALRRGLPAEVANFLAGVAASPCGIAGRILNLIEDVDHPEVQRQVARAMAAVAERLEGTDSVSPWLITRGSRAWNDMAEISKPSRDALAELWLDGAASKHLREQAFRLWREIARPEDVDAPRRISPDDDLHAVAVRSRVMLGDDGALPIVVEELAKPGSSGRWWEPFQRRWWSGMASALDEDLLRIAAGGPVDLPRELFLPKVIKNADPGVVDGLLEKHGAAVGALRRLVQAALYVASSAAVSFARREIAASDDPATLLRYLSYVWEIGGTKSHGRVTPARLAAIEPYIPLLEGGDVHSLWSACNREGLFEWRRAHLDAVLPADWRRNRGIDDDDIIRSLDGMIGGHRGSSRFLVEHSRERGDPPERLPRLLASWMAASGGLRAFAVVCDCLKSLGRRDLLPLLDAHGSPLGPDADALRKDVVYTVCRRSLV